MCSVLFSIWCCTQTDFSCVLHSANQAQANPLANPKAAIWDLASKPRKLITNCYPVTTGNGPNGQKNPLAKPERYAHVDKIGLNLQLAD